MSIVFEKTNEYDGMPDNLKEIAETYLLGKKFDSIDAALKNQEHKDHSLD